MKFTKKSKLFKILLSLALAVTVLTYSNVPVLAIQGSDPGIHGSDISIHGSDPSINGSSNGSGSAIYGVSTTMPIIIGYNQLTHQYRPEYYMANNLQIKNASTGHFLNEWVTDANYLYNGCSVTPYDWYENDNTQWFNIERVGYPQTTGGVRRTEVLLTSVNTRYALNIAYRGAGSNVVMYDRYLDTETWILEQYGENYAYSRFVLKSNPSVSLHENPYTHQIYLDYVGVNSTDVWYIAASYISLPNGFPY